MPVGEAELSRQLKAGDPKAFKVLVDQTGDHMFNVCFSFVKNREDAEDLVQQVFIDVMKHIKNFREDAGLSTWMYRIAVNRSLNYLKSNKRKIRTQSLDDMMSMNMSRELAASERTDEDAERNYRRRSAILETAVRQLPDNQKIAVILNKYEKLSYQEIAGIMGLSVSAVTALINRGKNNLTKKIRKILKKNGIDPQGF